MTHDFPRPLSCVLFDLDGTLVDSAPGLYKALCAYANEEAVAAPPFSALREVVSRGARAMLQTIWHAADEQELVARAQRFIELYQPFIHTDSPPFAGVSELLDKLEQAGIRWGVVTNKHTALAKPFLQQIGWWSRMSAFIAGDTLPVNKPHPDTVLDACRQADVQPQHTIFVGDDARDIEAGNKAGTHTIAVTWGYLNHSNPDTWQADSLSHSVTELTTYLLSTHDGSGA